MVAVRQAGPDHPDGLAADVLEDPAGSGPLGHRPRRVRTPDRRPDCPSGGPAPAGPAGLALDLGGRVAPDGALGPSRARPPGDGLRRLDVRPEPEPAGPRVPGDDGTAPGRLRGRDVPAVRPVP